MPAMVVVLWINVIFVRQFETVQARNGRAKVRTREKLEMGRWSTLTYPGLVTQNID